MEDEQEIQEIELVEFAIGTNPNTGRFSIWAEPYNFQVLDEAGGQWSFTYYPPAPQVEQDDNGFKVHATPRKTITQRFDLVVPRLRVLLGREAKRRKVGAPKKWNRQELEAQIKAAMQCLPSTRRNSIKQVADEMGIDHKYLRTLCRDYWVNVMPQFTIKRIAATIPEN